MFYNKWTRFVFRHIAENPGRLKQAQKFIANRKSDELPMLENDLRRMVTEENPHRDDFHESLWDTLISHALYLVDFRQLAEILTDETQFAQAQEFIDDD